jgi:hypothetical protein
MRIQSDFKDFYDVGMGQGQDQSLIYNRFEKVVEVDRYPFSSWFTHDLYSYRPMYGEPALYTDQYMIGFCGRMYPVLELNEPGKGHMLENSKEARASRVYCYKIEDVDNFVRKNYPKQWDDYDSKGYVKRLQWSHHQRRSDFLKFFEACDRSKDQYGKWFEDERAPILLGHCRTKRGKTKSVIKYNTELRPFDFMRVMDPYTAFQEISMWLGNQAEPRKPIPVLDDVTMAEIKGFNKFSFRKDKSK